MIHEFLEIYGQTPTETVIAAAIMEMVEDTLNYEVDSNYQSDYQAWAKDEKGVELQIITRPSYARSLFQDLADTCLMELETALNAWEDALQDTQFEANWQQIKQHWLNLNWVKVWDNLDQVKVSTYKLI